jgi:predicted HTH transcriptional regulator
MSDFQNEMNRTVQGFVAQITELARRAAITTLESAFNGKASRSAPAAPAVAALVAPSVARAGRPRGGRGAKRTPADLEALSEKFASFVKANPGLRIEQINKELGTSTKDLALPIRKLIADGIVSAKGQKRSTTYSPGKKASKK